MAGELGEFLLAGFERVELDGQVTEAMAAGAFIQGAVLEGGQVAVGGHLGLVLILSSEPGCSGAMNSQIPRVGFGKRDRGPRCLCGCVGRRSAARDH